jgi:hypothetical protein
MSDSRHKLRLFIALCVACAVLLAGYFLRTKTATGPEKAAHSTEKSVDDAPAPKLEKPVDGRPRQILFRYTGIIDNYAHYGKLAVADLARLDQPRFIDSIPCESVYFASGNGICLSAKWGALPSYSVRIFDADFSERFTFPLKGTPSRTRVSPDGNFGAFTVFLTGHSYASVDFTTETSIMDMMLGQPVASLEDFQVSRDGQPFKAPDFNFWGVTFTRDSKGFYCTLSSNKKHYLVKGDIAAHTATVIHENVECPSLSPDGLRVAYKKRLIVQGRLFWQLHMLDLVTKTETPLSEKRSVDDQLEWLDNDHVLYTMSENPDGSSASTNVWKADSSGKNPPEMFLPLAYSPAVVR